LKHALQKFSIDVAGRDALDIGASTGGFTDVLLRCGARKVVALDVGHGQLDWELRQNPRVVVLERVNARALERAPLPDDLSRFDIVSIDVSFISLTLILPGLPARLNHRADLVALVKPQFEAGRAEIGRGGIVRDPTVHARVIEQVVSAGDRLGLSRVNTVESPITGAEGNREFFLHFKRAEDIDSDSEPT
jgi:23S rRNA (cytidine1920-2'-O)/16S rRNA (cytidine1409-2'-O)-methyltransferase